MKCDDVQLLLSDFEDGGLNPAETARLRQHLESCPACADEAAAQRRLSAALRAAPVPQPSPGLPTMFHTWLESEREAASARARELSQPRASWLRSVMGGGASALAASVLFAAGLFIGVRWWQQPAGPAHDHAMVRELAHLREEVQNMNRAVTWSVLQQGSASDRLQTVLATNGAPARAQMLNELLGVVAYDPSATVRQSAVGALYRYAEEATVRRAVATALLRETSPVVQLAMIDLLASTRDPVAADALTTFAHNEASNVVVRDAASLALTRM